LFQDKRKKDETQKQQVEEIERLYKQIGQLTVENDRMKKKSSFVSL
jgi:cell shape-determining protein MreC